MGERISHTHTRLPATVTTWSRIMWAALGLALLVLLFIAGAQLYVHVVGKLFAQALTLPPVLLIALAAIGGAASFFSPCGIAITPSFLAYLIGNLGGSVEQPVKRSVLLGAAIVVAAGTVSFYLLAGALISWIGAIIYNYLIYLIAVVGVVFLGLAYVILTGRGAAVLLAFSQHNPANRYYDELAEGHQLKRGQLYAFGWAYGAASHTCTLPIFLGIVTASLASGWIWLAGLATIVYGGAIAVLLLLMSLLGEGALSSVQRRLIGRYTQLATGVLFAGTGVYLLYYFIQNYGGGLL